MQTNFTEAQLRDPRIAEADAILRTCVHYGFCTNTCPTYVLTRDENESPRGRIDLIRAMLEKGGAPDAKTVAHLDILAVPGASAYFLGGEVVYTELARAALLGISDAEMQGLCSWRGACAIGMPRFGASARPAQLDRPAIRGGVRIWRPSPRARSVASLLHRQDQRK
jgi:hypothetical protein